ncbi:HAMP domain-containing sensor histidine kinase [Pelomonas sp. SE-A7]|uniref:sensor histidine kinase n=1 Tax=Pelomonas sp. SE-A7 TaxID=3054953 RepID=UPI00259C7AB1|nr:HAMP domain-containing sensor histidine kinase [Pelomonas sp. SE-A7]MDM4767888.1 HAMP domain-containing sensor histidine kinase [Pelomonas sp. SE-A7]
MKRRRPTPSPKGLRRKPSGAANQQVRRLEQQLQERSRELEQAMKLLLQSEKLAALGNVVAGVAHELSTPIGNALLAATNLQQETQLMNRKVRGDSLNRRDLDDYMNSVDEGASIVARSLERAANLVRSFKSVAVNETSEARMAFDLRTALEDCLALLNPGLRHQPVSLELKCPGGVECDSYPGALTQVVNNLVENAVRHGLEPKGRGSVRIEAAELDGWILLTVSDDGVGIAPEHLGRIFEPFFTTRLGQGGSGLGLHLVHSLATGPLAGEVQVHSRPGEGTRFELRFPLKAPDNRPAPA